ncbi:hypothetical protein SHKM778_51960 [Streptomyces sp. KM77-8]|uniref:Molecular chaperone HtpG n=1 Tax=Streptomyces haneummycinicus TaxID=3074435 RepID=A0AAT9HN00_9ACTN
MVADEVTLLTRRAGEPKGTRWTSRGEGTYTLEAVDDAPQGTSVVLHLKPADPENQLHDYASVWTVKEIVKRYSDFITWPIRLVGESGANGDGGEAAEPETLNSMKALWARSRDEVSEEEYHELYKHIGHDWREPLETIQLQAEGTFEYQALLFVPSHAPHDLFQRDSAHGLQLYVKRVFIMDGCEALLPSYLRFVKGVVDAQDLSLNVSREILQQDRHIRMMQRRLTKKVLSSVKGMLPEDTGRYATFWREFGAVLKEGLVTDPDNRDALLAVTSFATTHGDGDGTATLKQYVERMPEGQDAVWYVTGESRESIGDSPHMEAFRERGIEVLLLTDPVDEVWVDAVSEYDGKPLRSIAKGEVDLGAREDDLGDEAGEAGRGVRGSARLDAGTAGGGRQGGASVDAADGVPGLSRGRRERSHPGAGEHVPGHGPGGAGHPAHPGTQRGPRAGEGPQRGVRGARGPLGPHRHRRTAVRAGRAGGGRPSEGPGAFRAADGGPAGAHPVTRRCARP